MSSDENKKKSKGRYWNVFTNWKFKSWVARAKTHFENKLSKCLPKILEVNLIAKELKRPNGGNKKLIDTLQKILDKAS